MNRIGPTSFVGASPEDLRSKLLSSGKTRRRKPRGRRKGPGGLWVTRCIEGEISLPPYRSIPMSEFVRDIRAAQAGDIQARNRLWIGNSRLVIHVLGRYGGRAQNIADLCQTGQFGVLRAIERFELDRLGEFSTYASFWIRSKADRSRYGLRYRVTLPAHAFDEIRKHVRSHANALNRNEQFDIDEALFQKHERRFVAVKRAMAIVNAESLERAHATPSQRPTWLEKCVREDTLQEVRKAISQLDERDQKVIALRYGLDGGEPLILREIGRRLGVTRERVRQIQVQAEDQLRAVLAGDGHDFSLLNEPLPPNRTRAFRTTEYMERKHGKVIPPSPPRLAPTPPPREPYRIPCAVSSQFPLFPQKARRTIRL